MKISASRIAVALCALAYSLVVRAQPASESVWHSIEQAEARAVEAGMRDDLSAMAGLYADPAMGQTAALRWKADGRPRFQILNLEVRGDVAIENGRVGDAVYLSIWSRQPDGTWKVLRDLWANRVGEYGITSPTPVLAPRMASSPAGQPAADVVPIPDPRSLGSAFIRSIQDDLKGSANRLRSLADAEKLRRAAAKADRDLQKVIRDVGWIDVGRFGTVAACNAAYIVSQSGDAALMRATLPLMEQDLNDASYDRSCYEGARKAYQEAGSRSVR